MQTNERVQDYCTDYLNGVCQNARCPLSHDLFDTPLPAVTVAPPRLNERQWACMTCTFINDDGKSCLMCEAPRVHAGEADKARSKDVSRRSYQVCCTLYIHSILFPILLTIDILLRTGIVLTPRITAEPISAALVLTIIVPLIL